MKLLSNSTKLSFLKSAGLAIGFWALTVNISVAQAQRAPALPNKFSCILSNKADAEKEIPGMKDKRILVDLGLGSVDLITLQPDGRFSDFKRLLHSTFARFPEQTCAPTGLTVEAVVDEGFVNCGAGCKETQVTLTFTNGVNNSLTVPGLSGTSVRNSFSLECVFR